MEGRRRREHHDADREDASLEPFESFGVRDVSTLLAEIVERWLKGYWTAQGLDRLFVADADESHFLEQAALLEPTTEVAHAECIRHRRRVGHNELASRLSSPYR